MTREIALHCMKSYSELHSDLCKLCPIYGQTGSDHCFEDALQYVIGMLEQEPCEDTISRKSIKQKLQEHHDFFVNAYGGFSNLPQNDKSRVDAITNCIAMVVNEPSVTPQPQTGYWEWMTEDKYRCSNCNYETRVDECMNKPMYDFCPFCGVKMVQESEEV